MVAAAICTLAPDVRAEDPLNSSNHEGQGDEGPPKPARYELNLVPIVGASSDIGFAAGFFGALARLDPDRMPFVWKLEMAGTASAKRQEGSTVSPYQSLNVTLTLPRLFGTSADLEIAPSYAKETTLGYHGMGNASSDVVPPGAGVLYSQYGRVHPEIGVRVRTRMADHVAGRFGVRYSHNRIDVAPGSKLDDDRLNGETEVRRLVGNVAPHSVALVTAGVQWDDRDGGQATHLGSYHQLEAKGSPGGSQAFPYRYAQVSAILRSFLPVAGRTLTLALRAAGDVLIGDAPFYELARFDDTYAVGGASGVRGVPAQRYYGKVKALGNIEVRTELVDFHALGKNLVFGVVGFFDAGRVWADLTPHPELDGTKIGIKYGTGGGLRILSGQSFVLRLDIAWSPDARPFGGYFGAGQMFLHRRGTTVASSRPMTLFTKIPFELQATQRQITPVPRPLLSVSSFGLSDRGRVRETNEDQFVTASLMRALWIEQSSLPQTTVRYADARGHVFIVADGMGGVAGGEKASAIAVSAVEDFLLNALRWLMAQDSQADTGVLRDFKAALRKADACVYGAASAATDLQGMGTTLTLAYTFDDDLFLAHAGDSRAYVLRGAALTQITRDDTLVQEMVESGSLTPVLAAEHELRHIVTNVVGGPTPGVHAAVSRMKLLTGDVLLLCSDGLTDMLTNEEIEMALRNCGAPQSACEELVALANRKGGADNITVVVARYVLARRGRRAEGGALAAMFGDMRSISVAGAFCAAASLVLVSPSAEAQERAAPRESSSRRPGEYQWNIRVNPLDLLFGRASGAVEAALVGPLSVGVLPTYVFSKPVYQSDTYDVNGWAIAGELGIWIDGSPLRGFAVKLHAEHEAVTYTIVDGAQNTTSRTMQLNKIGALLASQSIHAGFFSISTGIGVVKDLSWNEADHTVTCPGGNASTQCVVASGLGRGWDLLGELGLGVAF